MLMHVCAHAEESNEKGNWYPQQTHCFLMLQLSVIMRNLVNFGVANDDLIMSRFSCMNLNIHLS